MKTMKAAAILLAGLVACGGNDAATDARPEDPPVAAAKGLDRFLLFPNPQLDAARFQTDTVEYAQAYYRAVDEGGRRTTLADWRRENGFDSGSGEEVAAVFGDARDLGYGRRMIGRRNADGSMAFMVENYLVGGYAGDLRLAVEAAVLRDTRWLVGINAIEFSAAPGGTVPFAKFFNFNPKTGARETMVDLDGRGAKAMPGVCLSCHGGRGDALEADGSYPRLKNAASRAAGDAAGKLHGFEVDAFVFSELPGYTRAEQEAALKRLNQFVLCSWPNPAVPLEMPAVPCTRRQAQQGEWPGSMAAMLLAAYGGAAMPEAIYTDRYLPESWLENGQAPLYRDVVAPMCRACHLLRGTDQQSSITFDRFDDFDGYRDRLHAHLVDRGNMPLARIVYEAYWASQAPEAIARFLEARDPSLRVRDASGAPLEPGRLVAQPGPARRAWVNEPLRLSGEQSLHADGFRWTLVGPLGSAVLQDPDQAVARLTPLVEGEHVVRLVVTRAGLSSEPVDVSVFASAPAVMPVVPVSFADVKSTVLSCTTSCHVSGNDITPVSLHVGANPGDQVNDDALHAALRSRVNLTDIAASPLLRKPAGHQHGGARIVPPAGAFDDTARPGDPARSSYDVLLDWALAGAPR